MSGKETDALTRAEMVVILLRFNPFGGYCTKPCKHPGHSDDSYRRTVRKIRGES